ncbi:DUF421 domain-containing protein [Brochothrix thermosphacta]|uniref:DUF421 domain-containing protein n=1 Tax=Brochothrix thermosphacta TaxID=2756 RepID=UPI0003E84B48|nr:DUF421 domain-containing protein [Brochothrix thermosphacta]EUJ34703.1 hypothetical protein BTHER_11101 [Brochothrix thermosphacta DSM 20171 = FSL F6-1036]ODJ50256.1 hypothetical protein BFR34_04220 [Brochothrix thermosphacta DSM 20171 = FSL F6-1036]
MELYYTAIVKLSLGFICLIFQINLLGKGNLAPSSAMDQVQNYVLGGIIGGVIYNQDITILQFFLVLVIWTIVVFTLKFLKNHNRFAKNIIDGRPVGLIINGKVIVEACLRSGISGNDLTFKLRALGIYEIKTVKRAVMEQNGQLTVIQYGDDNIKYPLIIDGQINEDVLDLIQKDAVWVLDKLTEKGYQMSDIYIGEYDKGAIVLYPYK